METDSFKSLSYEAFKILTYELLRDEKNVVVVGEF